MVELQITPPRGSRVYQKGYFTKRVILQKGLFYKKGYFTKRVILPKGLFYQKGYFVSYEPTGG